jgi:hypothetical protein
MNDNDGWLRVMPQGSICRVYFDVVFFARAAFPSLGSNTETDTNDGTVD